MQYVIVGAGPSGVTAAETLRSADPDATVVLVDGEKDPPYGRMAIPYFLTGKVSEEGVYLRKAENHFENLGIKYIQARAKSVSHDDNTLTLDSGETVAFDKMLVATGSHPIKPRSRDWTVQIFIIAGPWKMPAILWALPGKAWMWC